MLQIAPRASRGAALVALAFTLAFLIVATLFVVRSLPPARGMVMVYLQDPEVTALIGDRTIDSTHSGQPLRLPPGEYTLQVRRGLLKLETEHFELDSRERISLAIEHPPGQLLVKRDGAVIASALLPPSDPTPQTPTTAADVDHAVAHVRVVEAVKQLLAWNAQLTIDHNNNYIPVSDAASLPENLTALHSVDFNQNAEFVDDHLKVLQGLEVYSLALDNTALTAGGLGHLRLMQRLDRLVCNSTKLDDAALAPLVAVPGLRIVEIGGNPITDEGLETLLELPRLEELALHDTLITDRGAAALGRCTTLTSLDVSSTKISSAGVSEFAALSELSKLNLNRLDVGDDALDSLVKLKKLKTLEMAFSKLTDAGAARLMKELPECRVVTKFSP